MDKALRGCCFSPSEQRRRRGLTTPQPASERLQQQQQEGEAGEGESQNHDADGDVDEQPGDQLLNNKNTVGAIEVDTELVNQRRQGDHDGAGAVVAGNGFQDIESTQV